MYEARQKIHPREVSGRFQRLRTAAVFLLLGLYYLVPWLRWDERQAVLFDLPARKFHVFWLTLWPQDLFYLTALLITAALSLFFFTALFGRVWCGYACPQTVWTEVYIWMERWTEGKRHQRMKLDKAPMSLTKFRRKAAKQFLWVTFSLFTGFTFVGYFTPIDQLAVKTATLSLGGWETFWILFYSAATYGNAGFMREQVCKYMCPYARFQSAMFDRDTLIIAYDETRGEPRGGRRRGSDAKAAGLGDCISCNKCVQVCPTGIDIRDGLQYECIACAACVDVCNEVMDTMGYPRNLVRYTTENAVSGKDSNLLRPRILVYAALLLAVLTLTVVSIASRTPLRLDVIRDRNSLYRIVDAGYIENVYSLRIMNMDNNPHRLTVEVSGISGLDVETEPASISVPSGAIEAVAARISVPPNVASGGHDILIRITSADGSLTVEEPARFMAPVPQQ
ncbi:MAG: cytochrome c oxidase accessory protein CcoG [Gammaproteobacteria bacterium]|nr:cytochrome c oxidase accessory protein CcoG [Gammaproteobacteria bacterium]NNF62129.1 cytochrome c oxidase accessory protein CcoG [Gammaproteobacteria bacterium]